MIYLVQVSAEDERSTKATRLFALYDLQIEIGKTMVPVEELSQYGFPATTSNGLRLRVHFLLASYAADLPDVVYLFSLEREASRKTPCHRCLVHREHLQNSSFGAPRRICGNMEIMAKNDGSSEKAHFQAYFAIHLLFLVLHDFSFVVRLPCIDI